MVVALVVQPSRRGALIQEHRRYIRARAGPRQPEIANDRNRVAPYQETVAGGDADARQTRAENAETQLRERQRSDADRAADNPPACSSAVLTALPTQQQPNTRGDGDARHGGA